MMYDTFLALQTTCLNYHLQTWRTGGEMGMEWERNRRAWGSGVGNWGILCYTLRQVIGRSMAGGTHADSIGQLSRRGYVGPEAEF